jgi:hypothetical protein
MKSYLRLLLVASMLLLVLGLFNDQRSETVMDSTETLRLEQVAVISGKLPFNPVHASPQIISKTHLPRGFLENLRLGHETHQSRLLSCKIQVFKRIGREISPDLLQRTGYFIYIHSGSEIPS